MDETRTKVTRLLDRVRTGDRDALDELFAILYDELRDLARRQRDRWRGNETLNTTAILHEAYVKLVDRSRVDVANQSHFRALAARAMRHILCDYARDQGAQKRGGGLERFQLDDPKISSAPLAFADEDADVLVALDEALQRLEQLDPRQSQVIECRFFGGLTIDETALAIGVSARTVKRDWAMAQAWLHREMQPQQ